MDDRIKIGLGLGAAGLLAFLYVRSRGLAGAATLGSMPGASTSPAVISNTGVNAAFTAAYAFDRAALTASIPQTGNETIADDGLAGMCTGPGLSQIGSTQQLFLDQTVALAAKIPLTCIQPRDVTLAMRLLSGSLDHNAEQYTESAKFWLGVEQADQTASAVEGAVASIVAIIPVVGAILGKGLQLMAAQAAADATSLAKDLQSGSNVKIAVDFAQATPITKMALGNPSTDQKYLADSGLLKSGGDSTVAFSRRGFLEEYFNFSPADRAQVTFIEPPVLMPHPRLFTRSRSGYTMPWLSVELGCGNSWPTQTGITFQQMLFTRAMCYRVLDMLISQFWPPFQAPYERGLFESGAGDSTGDYSPDGIAYQGAQYCYHNPRFGDIWGSTIPPYAGEDTNIVLADGSVVEHTGFVRQALTLSANQSAILDSSLAYITQGGGTLAGGEAARKAFEDRARQGTGEDLSATPGATGNPPPSAPPAGARTEVALSSAKAASLLSQLQGYG